MTDRRFLAANDRVAHNALKGRVEAGHFTDGTLMRCTAPWMDLCRAPAGARDTQILFGQGFQVLDIDAGWAFGYAIGDGYVGYLPESSLDECPAPTHRVIARLSHVYSAPDIKSSDIHGLSFLSNICVSHMEGDFGALATGGFVPKQHFAPLDWQADDAVEIAESLMGVPYLWGGNTATGIDCSGLVQLACHAIGLNCPRDSDIQAGLWQDVADKEKLQRGDLVCWKGHVGLMQDADMLLHANAHHMMVAAEPFAEARNRIAQNEFGNITTIRRRGSPHN